MKIGDEITIKAKIVDFDESFIQVEGYNSLKFWIHRPTQPDVIVEKTKTCVFCGSHAVSIPTYKEVYKCPRCGAEGETIQEKVISMNLFYFTTYYLISCFVLFLIGLVIMLSSMGFKWTH